MAENKKSFVLYADLIHTVKKMRKEDAGELLVHILKYVNDENPNTDNIIVDLTFEPIKQQFKRDLKKWETTIEKRSEAGKASAEARRILKLNEQNLTNSTHVKSVEQTSTNSTVNVNENVTVNDTVNVNVITSTIVEVGKENLDDDENKKSENYLDEQIKTVFLKNQEEEKIKKVAPKKESNNDFANSLKFESPIWLDDVCIQQKKPPDEIIKKIDEFLIFLKTHEKNHPSRKEFISHFVNWVSKKYTENGKPNTGSKTNEPSRNRNR